MHGFTLSIPLGTEVGPLQVPKGCGVQVGGGLMTIGSWPRGCPELVDSSGVIHGTRGRVIRYFSKGHTPSRDPYWFDLRKFLMLRPSQDYPGVKISPCIKVPRVESLKVTPLRTIMICVGGGRGVWLMLMSVLMSISRGGSRETEFCTWGTMGGVITWWSHFCRPLGGVITR